ncbi:MAG: TatD family hydrolase [Clostridia bacterium]|nr:TatD family hydrolase [Clostridia bacterium]
MEYFDAHAHYDDNKFDEDREQVLTESYKQGITAIVSAGYNLQGTKAGIELAKKYSFIYTTVGISPNDLTDNWENDIKEIEKILLKEKNNKKILAIGEIGLDYHYNTDKEKQKKAFKKQIEIANRNQLPIVIHTRNAIMDTLTTLKENPANKKGIFHCCPHNRELVKEAIKLGYYISFGGTVTFKNSKNAEEIVKMVPIDKFVIETDCPYLSPEPVRGTRNDSRNLKYIVKKIAQFKGVKEQEIAKQSYKNAEKVYEIIK